MYIAYQKITIIRNAKPKNTNINESLQWFGNSLGLFNLRDKDKSCFRIFIELLKAAKRNSALSSDELASNLNLSRGTVVHHLSKLIEAGMVISYKNKYLLRVQNLSELVDELEADLLDTIKDLKSTAALIDQTLS